MERPASAEPANARASRARLFASLPRLSATTALVRNRVYRQTPLVLSNDHVLLWQDPGNFVRMGELACVVGTAPLAIAADNLARLEPRLEGFESFVPTDTCAALVEQALGSVLELLERVAGAPVEVTGYTRPAASTLIASDEVGIGFVMLDMTTSLVLRGWMRASADLWSSLDFSRAIAFPTRRQRAVPVRLAVRLGHCRLSARELSALRPGDALRPTPRLPRDASTLAVTLSDPSARLSMAATLDGEELCLESLMNTSIESLASSTPSEPGSSDAPGEDLLSEIDCELSFELGSMRMSVADVSRLRAGQTLRMGVRLQDQPIRILVSGRVIGRGELAAIGDELVVVVTDTARLPHV